MTERKLRLQIDLRHRALQFRKIKERIITESACAARCAQNHAVHAPVRRVFGPAIARCNQNAVIAGCAILPGVLAQPLQQNHVVPDVGVVIGCIRRIHNPHVCSKSCRAHTRRSLQRIHLKPRIVRNHQFARSKARIIHRLHRRVLSERHPILIRSLDVSEPRKRLERDSVSFRSGVEVAQLTGAAGCNIQAECHRTSVMCGSTGVFRIGWLMMFRTISISGDYAVNH